MQLNPELSAVSKIDLFIDHDWTDLISAYNAVREKWISGTLRDKKWVDEYQTYQFDFGAFGSLISLDSISDQQNSASMLNGKIVESFLPWIKQMKHDFMEIDLIAVTFFETKGPIKRHADGVVKNENFKGHCRLNYIITDCEAITYVDNNGKIESYPSHSGTAWLLDTQKPHWVENSDTRHLFQLSFNRPYHEVLAWFRSNPKFYYGNQ
jgi:hypothetical protein